MKHLKRTIFAAFLAVQVSVLFAASTVSTQRQELIDFALKLRGIPYVYAGRSEEGFDCSGFVHYVALNAAGVTLSPQTSAMYAQVDHIKTEEREPGDLIFFAYQDEKGIYHMQHVGIYLGLYNGKNKKLDGKRLFVHSASAGPETGIIVSSIDERYWSNLFYGYGRFLPASAADGGIAEETVRAFLAERIDG